MSNAKEGGRERKGSLLRGPSAQLNASSDETTPHNQRKHTESDQHPCLTQPSSIAARKEQTNFPKKLDDVSAFSRAMAFQE